MAGAPPEGHVNQCRAKSTVTRRRCRRWALRGSHFCQFHGGRRSRRIGLKKLPKFYSKFLGPKLKERIEELLSEPHDVQVSLYQELAIARSTACEAIRLSQPLWNGERLTTETKALMIQTLSQAMVNVKELVLAASRIEKERQDKVSIKVINLIVYQIVIAINEVCGTENKAIAEAIALAIDEKVRLPINEKLTPNIRIDLGDNDNQYKLPGSS